MKDKKNIVIKVKYPKPGLTTENSHPKLMTEWNFKRIALAAAVLVVVLMSLFSIFNHEPKKSEPDNAAVPTTEVQLALPVERKEADMDNLMTSKKRITETNSSLKSKKEPVKKNKPAAINAVKETIKKQPDQKDSKESEYSHKVLRSSLTYQINNKEPAGEIARALNISGKKPTWIYYFTELKAMKGDKVYHEWLKNGVLVSRHALVISGDTWRTSSRKLLADSEKGKWMVRTVDEKGRLLNEKRFKVE